MEAAPSSLKKRKTGTLKKDGERSLDPTQPDPTTVNWEAKKNDVLKEELSIYESVKNTFVAFIQDKSHRRLHSAIDEYLRKIFVPMTDVLTLKKLLEKICDVGSRRPFQTSIPSKQP